MIFASLLFLIATSLNAQSSRPLVKVKGVSFQVELARSMADWQKGLMYRDDLKKRQGMLFLGEEERPQSFWMKNTPSSLDIIFIDRKLKIVSIQKNATPFSEKPLASAKPATHVLEILAGQADELKLKAGDAVQFLGIESR